MNYIQKELEQLKVDREVDEHNESHEFRLGYVKAMCHAINLVKNLDLPVVNNRTFIVTIECGEDTTDWKITAPNELAAKITASANYKGKQHKILRCTEYGC